MTAEEILKIYRIEMINYLLSPAQGSSKRIVKTFLGGGEMESFFGTACKSIDDINEVVIPIIQHFIDGNNPPMDENEANMEGIDNFLIVYPNGGNFFSLNDFKLLQIVPLDHLKIIAETWRDFLSQS